MTLPAIFRHNFSMTNSEKIVAQINSNVFFKEFTFSKNDFKELDTKQRLEFADNVVWLDKLFFIYQIKEQGSDTAIDKKWFDNKVLKKAVKQIKSTLRYIDNYPEIIIENEKGHNLNITEAKRCTDTKRIIIYSPNDNFSEDLRRQKFYESSEIGFVHLFHYEDYYWICKYLITPTEINQYLNFREDFFLFDKRYSNALPEQYFLGHFLETPQADHFEPKYITNLTNHKADTNKFDISNIMENFAKNIKLVNHQTEYYPIVTEIAKLNRSELTEFKQRVSLCVEKSETAEFIYPYRIYIPRTDCGFVFIPLHSTKAHNWKNALHNLTMAHKYESKAQKCIGVVIFRDKNDLKYFEFYWQYVNADWEHDEEMEQIFKENYPPFRKTKSKQVDNPYK
ncbi:MAG: hypothetical protein JWQ09_2739 [Segetibacter sp.]|nr:hypothetical protein [Segetibacter sp.]